MRNFPAQYNLQEQDVLYFSHIPKTAGMTFRTIVEDHFHEDETCPATLNAQVKKIPIDDFQRFRLFRGHLGFTNIPELIPTDKRLVNVTVVREPIARTISHYEYIRRMPGDPFYESVKDMSLADFARKLPAGKLKKNIQTYHIAKLAHFELEELSPQEIFELSKQSLDNCAFVGLVERFQDSLFLLSYIFGWRPIINTRRENAAKSKKSLDEIPTETVDVIKKYSQYDIELYQYAKEIFEQRFNQMSQDLVEKYLDQVAPELTFAPGEPVPSPLLAKLLDRHYNQRYADQQSSLPPHVTYDFAQPLRGSGWQRRERATELGDFRWIGPGTEATLDLPIAKDHPTDMVIEFRTVRTHLMASDIVNTLKVEVNGQPLNLYVLHHEHGNQLYQGLIPKAILQSDRFFTEFKFRVDRVISLQELNPKDPDTRLLGVALNFVQVFPADWRYEKSLLAPSLESPIWKTTADFLLNHIQPQEAIAAPLIFQALLLRSIITYSSFLTGEPVQWLILHKGNCDRQGSLLFKLMNQGFKPVFANEVFVVFTTRKDVSSLPYTSQHVKPLYIDYLKKNVIRDLKTAYRKRSGSRTNPAQRSV
jgi:hypothetical protein